MTPFRFNYHVKIIYNQRYDIWTNRVAFHHSVKYGVHVARLIAHPGLKPLFDLCFLHPLEYGIIAAKLIAIMNHNMPRLNIIQFGIHIFILYDRDYNR